MDLKTLVDDMIIIPKSPDRTNNLHEKNLICKSLMAQTVASDCSASMLKAVKIFEGLNTFSAMSNCFKPFLDASKVFEGYKALTNFSDSLKPIFEVSKICDSWMALTTAPIWMNNMYPSLAMPTTFGSLGSLHRLFDENKMTHEFRKTIPHQKSINPLPLKRIGIRQS